MMRWLTNVYDVYVHDIGNLNVVEEVMNLMVFKLGWHVLNANNIVKL